MPSGLVWLIFLLPVASFAIISLLIRPFVRKESNVAGYIAIAAIGGSTVLSLWNLFTVFNASGHEVQIPDITWLTVGSMHFSVGIIMDSLTAVMLVVVTTVSLMVQIYSQGYLAHPVSDDKPGDRGYHRYYAWMSLFTASMLGLVLADTLLLMYVFWELVGLCSYLLIGFWFHRPSAANAAKKAFIVTRLGDFGFLAAILLIFANTGTFDTTELYDMVMRGTLAGSVLTWAAIGIFSGAAGKSAQFPLHVWLPDAMEGPTPVSALIHAATMVAAGVFLVARTFPLFLGSTQALNVVAIIGAFTAIFAASMGLVMTDIKRVIAYSTISQLGYMMLGLGAAGLVLTKTGLPLGYAWGAEGQSIDHSLEVAKAATAIGIFHLFNHAFFKALLFLGAGSVNHATGTFDMRLMGGLRKAMPWTYATFLIGSLSLAGIWPLSGFWSKDEILAKTLEANPVLFVLVMITVFMTAFYIFRVIFLTFGGEYRGRAPDEHGHAHSYLHESPRVMVIPMVILACLAIFSGAWNITGGFNAFMGAGATQGFFHDQGLFGIFTHSALPLIALFVALLGIFLAYAIYSKKWLSAKKIGHTFKPFYTLFSRKYFLDDLYENIIVRKLLIGGIFNLLRKIDTNGVDGVVNGLATTTTATGRVVRRTQNGQLQVYGIAIGIGILAIIIVVLLLG
jgi:NADH-quinone oxidoreductase subunit L